MTDDQLITCRQHGETRATFACRHVTEGVACGYHVDPSDDPRPDAWCDGCEQAKQAAGGAWTEALEEAAEVRAMCTHCYDAARARNERPPAHAGGANGPLTAAEAAALLHHATHAMQAAQAASDARWAWIGMARWDYDDAAGTLTFTDPSRPTTVADVRMIGSFSTTSGTFQWAWQTFDDGDAEARDVARLRAFGEVRGLDKLTTPSWACDEAEAWEMASLAGYLLGAEALYRAPFDHVRWFMLLSNLRHPA